MPRIRILPDRVANQIAAGEVIERPAAVIKELVENALDAGATRIEVEFSDGGRALLRVSDNGHGMSPEDAQLALERHATSKIAEAGDLERLTTFGFRGEALPSIASVSDFTLRTRPAESDSGTEIVVAGGRLKHVRECGQPVGTSIEVANLFHPVPARRKFLKTDQTESAHIVQCVRLYALACPSASFTLIENGRVIFRSPECLSLSDRIREIFGRQVGESLLAIEAEEAGMRLSGLIGRPGVGRATRHEMITFVNSRPVDSRTLNYSLIESYHESVPKGRYPLAFVFFELDPAAVDVNVHPAKREVRFRHESAVRGFVIRAVMGRLRELHQAFAGEPVPAIPAPLPPAPLSAGMPPTLTLADLRGAIAVPAPAPAVPPADDPIPRVASPGATVTAPPAPPAAAPPRTVWRYLGLAHGDYALFETPSGILLLNRRAAHERVWFERLVEQFRAGAVVTQRLLLPVAFELDPVGSAILLEKLPFFAAHGFEISEFGRNFFRIEGLPEWAEPDKAEAFLRDAVGAMRDGALPGENVGKGSPGAWGTGGFAAESLAKLAAARAIRLPAAPSPAEMEALAAALVTSRNPLTSPNGRPTCIELGHAELSRRFQKP